MFSGLTFALGMVMATTMDNTSLLSYGKIFSIGIVALSLVPLVGFAGQISLCQLSFAGIGAIVMAHIGAGGNPLGVVAAVVVCALIGGLVALPALRLSGIYLALATAAFAVLLDRWIYVLPNFSIGPVHIRIFELGTVPVHPLYLFGVHFSSAESQMVLAVVVFVLMSLVVVWIRRSTFGHRLLAIRDSEAACATFGLNLIGTRLAVFMMSAAMAGLGGAIYATQLTTIGPNNFDFVTGLPIFMLLVVGGAGFVGGALFAGISLYGVLPFFANRWAWFAKIQTMTPGLIGIGLGREPSGVSPQFSAGFAELRDDTPVLVATLGAMGVAWVLRLAGVIGDKPVATVYKVGLVPMVGADGRRARRRPGRRRGYGPSGRVATRSGDRAGPAARMGRGHRPLDAGAAGRARPPPPPRRHPGPQARRPQARAGQDGKPCPCLRCGRCRSASAATWLCPTCR